MSLAIQTERQVLRYNALNISSKLSEFCHYPFTELRRLCLLLHGKISWLIWSSFVCIVFAIIIHVHFHVYNDIHHHRCRRYFLLRCLFFFLLEQFKKKKKNFRQHLEPFTCVIVENNRNENDCLPRKKKHENIK